MGTDRPHLVAGRTAGSEAGVSADNFSPVDEDELRWTRRHAGASVQVVANGDTALLEILVGRELKHVLDATATTGDGGRIAPPTASLTLLNQLGRVNN